MDYDDDDGDLMAGAELLRETWEAQRRDDFFALPEAIQNEILAKRIDRQMPDVTLIGPDEGAILRCMVYGVSW